MINKIARLLNFARFVLRRFGEDRCLQIASSLTYTTLLSLVPLVTITLTVIAAFPVFSGVLAELKLFILGNLVPQAAAKVITVYMQQFSENAARLTMLGIVFLGVTALMLMLTIDHAFNTIWRVARQRPLLNRVLTYWAMLTLGPLMIGASLSLTSYLVSLSLGWVSHIPAIGVLVLKWIPVLLTTLAFALLYSIVPNRFVPPSHALVGGVIAGLAFEAMKKFFTLYVTSFGSYKLVYGTFASLPIFLLWIYLSWVVVLLGAVIAASLSHWRGEAWRIEKTPGRQFYDALAILMALCRAQQRGEPVRLQQLTREVRLGLDDLEDILEQLGQANWARRIVGGGWALVREPDGIRVAEVYRLFVFQPVSFLPGSGGGEEKFGRLTRDMAAHIDGALQCSLKSLYSGTCSAAAAGGDANGATGTHPPGALH